jgi:hypothetical protein
MRQIGNRVITVKKSELISQIVSNKETHQDEYQEAIIAYKIEGIKQLNAQLEAVNNGSVTANLTLVTPIDNSANYDKIITMFIMEIAEQVELTQSEFNEYIHDEAQFAMSARVSNHTYS